MRTGKRTLASSLAAAACFVAAATVSAFVTLSPARTWDGPPAYVVDSTGLGSIADADGGATKVVNALIGTAAWNGSGSGTVITAAKGSVAVFDLDDGVPMLKFADPLGACTGTCLAATFTGYYALRGGTSYRIYDADIVTNSTGYSWTSQGEDPGGVGCSSEIYVEGVMVHEAGHGLGLGHSAVAGATMASSVSFCNNGPASTEADDEAGIVSLYGTAPCTGCTVYTDYLSGTGVSQYEPLNTYYFSSGSGTHQGWLVGPGATDFDLYLWKWDGVSWVQVASATSFSSTESISYAGSSGWYLWGVYSYSGAGPYHFWLKKP